MTQDRELFEGVFEDLKEETQEKKEQKRTLIINTLYTICALCASFYVFSLLIGNNSLSVLFEIKRQKAELEEQAQRLQKENVDLQKIIFELKGLEPTHEEF